jgi:SNF2 family DNA or RNA helicase
MFKSYLEKTGLQVQKHQVECVDWCVKNERDGKLVDGVTVRGGLIADDMGLGKTIQMLGIIVSNFVPRTLIVLPRSLLDQWEETIVTTLGHTPLVYHGHGISKITEEVLSASPIVLTTYGMITTRKDKDLGILHKIKWNRVVFDEAHHLRNKKARIHIGALKLQSSIRWLMTGTPIQNKKEDFYALCAVMGIPAEYYTSTENLMALVKAFIIKRTKVQVGLGLSPLTIKSVVTEWDNENEKNIAEDIHSLLKFSNIDKQVDNPGMWGQSHLPILTRARQMCICPSLMGKHLESLSASGAIDNSQNMREAIHSSSKIDKVVDTILERKDNNKGKIVFCHFRGEIDIIQARLSCPGIHVETFDGRTKQRKRHEILTGKCDVLILQIKTGCEGLNLQQFSEIYFVSPHWNPSVEDQAIGRCHRLGQSEKVSVFKFNMSGFDEDGETLSLDTYSTQKQGEKREVRKMIDVHEQPEYVRSKKLEFAEIMKRLVLPSGNQLPEEVESIIHEYVGKGCEFL